MKKQFCVVAIVCLTVIVSCKKTGVDRVEKSTPKFRQGVTLRQLTLTPEELLTFNDDAEYEKIDMARFCLGNAMKDYITVEISDYILNASKESNGENVDIETIFSEFPDFAAQVSSALAETDITGIPYDFSTFSKIKDAMVRNETSYDIEITVPNYETAETGSLPILSPGCDISETDAGDDLSADQVAAWDVMVAEDLEEINRSTLVKVNEDEMFATGIAFIVVTLADPPGPTLSTTPITKTTGNPWSEGDIINIQELKIHDRNEKSGCSQVRYNAYYKWAGYAWVTKDKIYGQSASSSDYYGFKDVEKEDIGDWVGVDEDLMHFMPVVCTTHPFGQTSSVEVEACVYNTYERDFWEGQKYIAAASGHVIRGRMTFDDDTYLFQRDNADQNAWWFGDVDMANRVWNNIPGLTWMGSGFKSEMRVEKH